MVRDGYRVSAQVFILSQDSRVFDAWVNQKWVRFHAEVEVSNKARARQKRQIRLQLEQVVFTFPNEWNRLEFF